MKCAECGREITNAHYINNIAYGYNCYKKKLAIIYKQWEDDRNHDYSVKCFSAMQIFAKKKSNSFQKSLMLQWFDCKKLTAKQLDCVIKGFTFLETIEFYKAWFTLASDIDKNDISNWTINKISYEQAFNKFIDDEIICEIIKNVYEYRSGFHFLYDVDEPEKIFICKNGNRIKKQVGDVGQKLYDNFYLDGNQSDPYIKVMKIIR